MSLIKGKKTMNSLNWKERRNCSRYPINKNVQLKLQNDLGRHFIHHYGYGEDIGLGGIRVKLLRYKDARCLGIKEGARIQIRIPVWGAMEYLELIGQVVWCLQGERGSNIGIQFLSNDNKESKG